MLTKFDVSTAQGDLLTLQLDDTSQGYIVQEIEGLDPVKATLVSSSFAAMDGEQYQSSRRETRNIKIQLGLDPDPLTDSVRSLRKRLYGYFLPKSEVTLSFYSDDGPRVSIVGRVESFETALFTQEPAVDISIICYDPDFYDPVPQHLSGNSTAGTAKTVVHYDGEVETGIVFKLNVNRTLTDFTIYHTLPSGELKQLDFSGSLVSGDVLTISTVTGDKGATLIHTGTSSSVLYAISPQSHWLELVPGDNLLRVYASGAGVPYTIDYTTRYGGL